ncbi:uncharacterized protein LOC114718301, partial [Neltuma alba]|uniref:uncharacterized protein LOC114718301 n=1 Tax=Neltuma alba TaxID=207710 RepID=UPI0010A576C9
MDLEIGVTSSDTPLESWFSSDRSTGYLEDVIAGWSVWYKQQNLPLYSLSQDQKETHCLADQIDIFPPCSSTRTQRLVDEGQKKRIAYPFEMVKRGGANGETVLEDINQQMRMSPAKPI